MLCYVSDTQVAQPVGDSVRRVTPQNAYLWHLKMSGNLWLTHPLPSLASADRSRTVGSAILLLLQASHLGTVRIMEGASGLCERPPCRPTGRMIALPARSMHRRHAPLPLFRGTCSARSRSCSASGERRLVALSHLAAPVWLCSFVDGWQKNKLQMKNETLPTNKQTPDPHLHTPTTHSTWHP